MSRAFEEKRKARSYAINTYRNRDILEERHASGVCLDNKFYYDMLNDMTTAIIGLKKPIETAMMFSKMSLEQLSEFQNDTVLVRVVGDCYFMTQDWDEPHKIRERFNKESTANNIAEFVLSGKFRQACMSGMKLTDPVMADLNRDIYNRFYTLVCRGVL